MATMQQPNILNLTATLFCWMLLTVSASLLFLSGQKTLASIVFICATAPAVTHSVLLAWNKGGYSGARYIAPIITLMFSCCIGALASFKMHRFSLALSAAACGIVINMLATCPWFFLTRDSRYLGCGTQIQVFVISLQSAAARQQSLKHNLSFTDLQPPVANIDMFPAVYAKKHLAQIQQSNIVSPETWKTLPIAVGGQGQPRKYVWGIDSIGAIGCTLSHFGVWQRVAESSWKTALILEDDAIFSTSTIVHEICKSLQLLPPDWDVLLLGYISNAATKTTQFLPGIVKVNTFFGTHAYLVSNLGAKKMLAQKDRLPIQQHIDAQMGEWSRKGTINLFALARPIIFQSAAVSQIAHGDTGSAEDQWDLREDVVYDP